MIKAVNLNKKFGKKTVINNANFEITEPAIIGLVGNNGSGKTTLVNLIMGYLKPSGGELKVLDFTPYNNVNVSTGVALVDEHYSYDISQKISKTLADIKDFNKNFNIDKAHEVVDMFNLKGSLIPLKMSKGMKMQFAIAIGMGLDKPIIMFDEPVAGLDEKSRYKFYEYIINDFAANPRTIIISTHLLGELNTLINQLIIIDDDGKVMHYNDTEQLISQYVKLTGAIEDINLLKICRKFYNPITLGNIKEVVIENDLTQEELNFIKTANIKRTQLKCNDICRILVNKEEALYERKHITNSERD